jgi:hypothetical protein
MQVYSGDTGVDGGGRGWYNGGDNQQMRRVLAMNEKKQSGYPQEDPRAELERLMQDKPLKRPGGKDRKEPPIMAVYAAPVIREEK